jgi:hypothetical protein
MLLQRMHLPSLLMLLALAPLPKLSKQCPAIACSHPFAEA